MKNEILRDVLAGCAGMLAVAAVIGLPGGSVSAHPPAEFQVQHAVLLPHFTGLGTPTVPRVPQVRISTRP
jgi:hypothetical protein